MNWDEKAEDYAGETGLSREAVLVATRWQRDNLRTDEAVERVANCLHSADHGGTLDDHDAHCERDNCVMRETYKRFARRAINALLGDD